MGRSPDWIRVAKTFPIRFALSYRGLMSETQSTPVETDRLNRIGASRLIEELTAAAIFLTRLPIRFDGDMPADLHGRALGWYPAIGALIGLGGALVYAAGTTAGLTSMVAALLTLGVQIAVTGALHEDGLADVADGFGGGRDKIAKLAIMRDSRLGSYGVLALIFSVGLRWWHWPIRWRSRRRWWYPARCPAPSCPPSMAGWTRRAPMGWRRDWVDHRERGW
jgi:cobalamin synthase